MPELGGLHFMLHFSRSLTVAVEIVSSFISSLALTTPGLSMVGPSSKASSPEGHSEMTHLSSVHTRTNLEFSLKAEVGDGEGKSLPMPRVLKQMCNLLSMTVSV